MAQQKPENITILCNGSNCEGMPVAKKAVQRARMNLVATHWFGFATYQCPVCDERRTLSFTKKGYEDITEDSLLWHQWGLGMMVAALLFFATAVFIPNVELVMMAHALGWNGFCIFGVGQIEHTKGLTPSGVFGVWLMGIGLFYRMNLPTMYAETLAEVTSAPLHIPEWWAWMNAQDRAKNTGIIFIAVSFLVLLGSSLSAPKKMQDTSR